jgi:hypothetical protein
LSPSSNQTPTSNGWDVAFIVIVSSPPPTSVGGNATFTTSSADANWPDLLVFSLAGVYSVHSPRSVVAPESAAVTSGEVEASDAPPVVVTVQPP